MEAELIDRLWARSTLLKPLRRSRSGMRCRFLEESRCFCACFPLCGVSKVLRTFSFLSKEARRSWFARVRYKHFCSAVFTHRSICDSPIKRLLHESALLLISPSSPAGILLSLHQNGGLLCTRAYLFARAWVRVSAYVSVRARVCD